MFTVYEFGNECEEIPMGMFGTMKSAVDWLDWAGHVNTGTEPIYVVATAAGEEVLITSSKGSYRLDPMEVNVYEEEEM